MRERKIKKIDVTTHVNGYSLEFEGQTGNGYLYHSVEEFIEGFMVRIGMDMTETMTMDDIHGLVNIMRNHKTMEGFLKEIERLKFELEQMTMKRNGIARQMITERNQRNAILKEVERIRDIALEYPKENLQPYLTSLLGQHHQKKELNMNNFLMNRKGFREEPDEEESNEEPDDNTSGVVIETLTY